MSTRRLQLEYNSRRTFDLLSHRDQLDIGGRHIPNLKTAIGQVGDLSGFFESHAPVHGLGVLTSESQFATIELCAT